MSGIVFFATMKLAEVTEFYASRLGMSKWIEQPDCTILRKDGFCLGFCQREDADTRGIITFLCDDDRAVDDMYGRLRDVADGPPKRNEKYRIYHFFLKDPEGRMLEVQRFLDL